MKSKSDDTLVELVKGGETNAFPELVRRYQQFCMGKAISVLRNRYDAEDEVQNAWIQVLTHLAAYRGQGSFDAWLRRIVSTCCLTRLRRARLAPTSSVDEVFDYEGPIQLEVIDQRSRPDEVVGNDEVLKLLNKEVNGLPPLYREVLVMRYHRQRGIGDIAADLGISVPAAKSRLMRARLELKVRLEKHHGGNGCALLLLRKPGEPLAAYVRMS